MQIRRPLAALLTALALAGGVLTACSSPTSAKTGTPADTAPGSPGGNPTGASQGNLPLNRNHQTGSSNGSSRAGGDEQGNP